MIQAVIQVTRSKIEFWTFYFTGQGQHLDAAVSALVCAQSFAPTTEKVDRQIDLNLCGQLVIRFDQHVRPRERDR